MSEKDAIAVTREPATVSTLVRDLHALGLTPGTTVIAHVSLSRLGWVAGAAQAVVLALEEALGPEGTLVMPAQSTAFSEPSRWENPPVPRGWWEVIRAEMPAFDRALTPATGMGSVAEAFRTQPGTLRSGHPQVSFAARGPQAASILDAHSLHEGLGDGSPLARLYDLDASVLLLGVGHGVNTSLHLCEYRASFPSKTTIRQGAPMFVEGARRWVEFDDLDWDEGDFEDLGSAYEREATGFAAGKVGAGEARLFRQRALVDYGVAWMERNRR